MVPVNVVSNLVIKIYVDNEGSSGGLPNDTGEMEQLRCQIRHVREYKHS